MTYPYTPYKKQIFPHYEDRLYKLELKKKEFSTKNFQKIRKSSKRKKILRSFGRVGMCLNDKTKSCISKDDLDKVCFILINDYKKEKKDLSSGPLNDGYLIALTHHRLGFKIFYLYNSLRNKFTTFLEFFLKNTITSLTVYYTGLDNNGEGIEFTDSFLSKNSLSEIISTNSKGTERVVFINDTSCNGSIFDVRNGSKNMLSFSTRPKNSNENVDDRLQGIFTFYLCKSIGEISNITPEALVEEMGKTIERFDVIFICEVASREISKSPIFS